MYSKLASASLTAGMRSAFTAVTSSSTVTPPLLLRSKRGHADTGFCCKAMLTPRTISSTETSKSPLQSPALGGSFDAHGEPAHRSGLVSPGSGPYGEQACPLLG